MLLSQQAQLVHLDNQRLVVRVAGTWMAMVKNRQSLLEKAITTALGQPRQLVLEDSHDAAAAPPAAPQAPPAPIAPLSRTAPVETTPQAAASAAPAWGAANDPADRVGPGDGPEAAGAPPRAPEVGPTAGLAPAAGLPLAPW